MRVTAARLLLLFGLCGPAVQGEPHEDEKQTAPDIWGELRELRDMVVEQKVELRSMEVRLRESQQQVGELQAQLTTTQTQVEQLQRNYAEQTAELISLDARLTATESKTSDLERNNADFQTRLGSSESRILQLETQSAAGKSKVAFYAALTSSTDVGPYDTDVNLKYINVYTNIGKAYSPLNGFFTAPVKGIYVFHFTAGGVRPGYMGVYMFKNNQRLLYNVKRNDNYHNYFTKTLVLELLAGDQVYLVLPAGQALFDNGNNHCTFSGFLLSPL